MAPNQLNKHLFALKAYIEKEKLKGYDPYDGLNSRFFQALPFIRNNRFFRLVWIQLFKRNPINFRKFLGVKKDYNPKGLGLFLIGYCNLYEQEPKEKYLKKITFLSQKIIELQSPGYSGACWGYNFDWQARAFFQPKYTPTVVATSFIVEALLKAFNITNNKELLETAISSANFVLKDLNRTYDKNGDFAFSYSPQDSTQVFNASLLGAKLLSQIYSVTKEKLLIDEAKKVVSFVCAHQQKNGAWSYGTLPFHQWIDSFHTGYNLECIYEYQIHSKDMTYKKNIEIGVAYYLNNFFLKNGASKYFNNHLYPIDVHAPAQLVVTLYKLGISDDYKRLLDRVLKWTIQNMQDKKGFFYYQKRKYLTNKIPYMRWTQAWMFYALSYHLKDKS